MFSSPSSSSSSSSPRCNTVYVPVTKVAYKKRGVPQCVKARDIPLAVQMAPRHPECLVDILYKNWSQTKSALWNFSYTILNIHFITLSFSSLR